MSDWSVVSDEFESTSNKAWEEDGQEVYDEVDLGPLYFSGPIYEDSLCLIKRLGADPDHLTQLCA